MIEIKRILIPTDFSDYSRYSLRYAKAFAQSFQAQLILMHCCEHSVLGAGTEAYHFSVPEYIAKVEENEKSALEELAAELVREGFDVIPVFAVGSAPTTIVEAAQEHGVDMIIIATHGRTGFSHLVFGSTAEKVVRLSPCPVLTVKNPEHDFIKP
jgi:nucleotide-binding universal stress UspA family protein